MGFSELSIEQKYAVCKIDKGQNVFITGPGGTGKSRLIQYLHDRFKRSKRKFQICALTGCAAVLLQCGACTIHSWSGIRLGKESPDVIISRIIRNRNLAKTWRNIQILIIDEVSMLSSHIFELLDEIARALRKNREPFGGIQMIFTGDFYQLPPVGDNAIFCFESPLWTRTFRHENCVVLRKIFRQNDTKYIEILQQIREGKLTPENSEILHSKVNRQYLPEEHNGCPITRLFPVRSKVDNVNITQFNEIDKEAYEFEYIVKTNCAAYLDTNAIIELEDVVKCRDLSETDIEHEVKDLLSQTQTPDTLCLKIGAAVMCTSNIDIPNGICNGSQGVIVNFVESHNTKDIFSEIPLVQFANGIRMCIHTNYRHSLKYPTIAVGQIPLCLAWALTIHKIQGATMRMAEIDIGKGIFEFGQTYVALSRIQSLDGLYLSSFHPDKIRTNPKVIAFYDSLPNVSDMEMEDFVDKHLHPEKLDTMMALETGIKRVSLNVSKPLVFEEFIYKSNTP